MTINENLDPENKISSENILRPQYLKDYVGQEKTKKELSVYIQAAQQRGEKFLDHMLVSGPPGLGKTTVANIVANEMEQRIHRAAAPSIEKPAQLISLLIMVEEGDFVFIDEIHALKRTIEEILYSAMEDFRIDISTEDKTVSIDIPKFTLIGATTRAGLLSAPFLDRFSIKTELDYYNVSELKEILKANGNKLGINYKDDALIEIAKSARGTPRIANNLLKRVADFALVENSGLLDLSVVKSTLSHLGIDSYGFDNKDRKMLDVMYHNLKNKPSGIDNIARTMNESKDTVERIIEPYLIKEGFIIRTEKGRSLTSKAIQFILA
jgi:Holliday junction DNA helicase RuvB